MSHVVASLRSPAEAAAYSGTYRLVARLWLCELDRDLLQKLGSPPLRDAFVEAGGILPAGDEEQVVEQLAVDYCRLLVGPRDHLPPYQSVWQSSRLESDWAASMQTFIQVAGYDTGGLPRGMMLDHLAVQLDVLGHILGEISARQAEPEILGSLSELAYVFFATHLTWPTELLSAAAQRAGTDFYRSAVLLTRNLLDSEKWPFSPKTKTMSNLAGQRDLTP